MQRADDEEDDEIQCVENRIGDLLKRQAIWFEDYCNEDIDEAKHHYHSQHKGRIL